MPTREYINGPTSMYVPDHFLNDIREDIDDKFLIIGKFIERIYRSTIASIKT